MYLLPKLVDDAAADGGAAAADDPGPGELGRADLGAHGQHRHQRRHQGQVGRLEAGQAADTA